MANLEETAMKEALKTEQGRTGSFLASAEFSFFQHKGFFYPQIQKLLFSSLYGHLKECTLRFSFLMSILESVFLLWAITLFRDGTQSNLSVLAAYS